MFCRQKKLEEIDESFKTNLLVLKTDQFIWHKGRFYFYYQDLKS